MDEQEKEDRKQDINRLIKSYTYTAIDQTNRLDKAINIKSIEITLLALQQTVTKLDNLVQEYKTLE